jgi:hypothetical protein
MPVLLNANFRVIEGDVSELEIAPVASPINSPTIQWSWRSPDKAPGVDYYILTVLRNHVPYDLGNDIGTELYTKEQFYRLPTDDSASTAYQITVEAVLVDQDQPSIIATQELVLTPTANIPLLLADAWLWRTRSNKRFSPIQVYCYDSFSAAKDDEVSGYKHAKITGIDVTDWISLLPGKLSEYNGQLEYYYHDGKIYTNVDIRSLLGAEGCTVLVYYRLYDAVRLEMDITATDLTKVGPRIYKYYLACLPTVFVAPIASSAVVQTVSTPRGKNILANQSEI